MRKALPGNKSFTVLVTLLTVGILLCAIVFFASSGGDSPGPAAAVSATFNEPEENHFPSPAEASPRDQAKPSRDSAAQTRAPSPTQEPARPIPEPVTTPPVEYPIASTASPAASTPPRQPITQPAQPSTEPDTACATGHLSISLDEVHLEPDGSFPSRQHVSISGRVRNDSNAAVNVGLKYEVQVVGIDSAGEVIKSYDPEIDYTPPPGSIRPTSISLPPGQTLNFRHSQDDLHTDWTTIKYWLIEPEFTLMHSSFTEYPPYPCDSYAQVEVATSPIPNRL